MPNPIVKPEEFLKYYPRRIETKNGRVLTFDEQCFCGAKGFVGIYRDKNGGKAAVKFPNPELLEKGQEKPDRFQDFKSEASLLTDLSSAGQRNRSSKSFLRNVYGGALEFNGKDLPYIAMEYAEKGDLDTYLASHDLSEKDRLCIATKLVRAVLDMHKQGIYSRDIKPANFLLRKNRDIVVSDLGFGTIKKTAELRLGTPRYMSPDIFNPPYDCKKVDQHSLLISIADVLNPNFFSEPDEADKKKTKSDTAEPFVILRLQKHYRKKCKEAIKDSPEEKEYKKKLGECCKRMLDIAKETIAKHLEINKDDSHSVVRVKRILKSELKSMDKDSEKRAERKGPQHERWVGRKRPHQPHEKPQPPRHYARVDWRGNHPARGDFGGGYYGYGGRQAPGY